MERAYVAGFLATGRDLGYIVDPDNPDVVFSTQDLKSEPLASGLKTLEGSLMDLDSDDPALRSQANRRVGLAVSFISMTPFTFAMEGR